VLEKLAWAEYQLHGFHGNKQQLVKVLADLEQTIVDETIDQWRKRLKACVKTKGQHYITLVVRVDCLYQRFFNIKAVFLKL